MTLVGAPGASRTRDLRLRRATLYPAELRVHAAGLYSIFLKLQVLNYAFFPYLVALTNKDNEMISRSPSWWQSKK